MVGEEGRGTRTGVGSGEGGWRGGEKKRGRETQNV